MAQLQPSLGHIGQGTSPALHFGVLLGWAELGTRWWLPMRDARVPEDSTWRWAVVGRMLGVTVLLQPHRNSSNVSRSKMHPRCSQHHFGPGWGCSPAGHFHKPCKGAQQCQQLALTGKPLHSRTPPAVTNAVSSLPPGLNLQSQQPEQSSVLKQLQKCNTMGKAELLSTAPSRASLVPAASCSRDAAPASKTPSPLAGLGV